MVFGDADDSSSVLKSYLGLVIIILLWICIWSLFDDISKKYLKDKNHKNIIILLFAIFLSVILVVFFPDQM